MANTIATAGESAPGQGQHAQGQHGQGATATTGGRPAAQGGTRKPSIFSRVTVVAPHTRIDVALPADVAVADLLPMLLEMAGEPLQEPSGKHSGWSLSRLAQSPLDPARTLASLGVVDGELLQLRKRNELPPPPLFDDVVDAVAAANPGSFRPWTEQTARGLGLAAGGTGMALAALVLYFAGPGIGITLTAGVAAITALLVGAVVSRVFRESGAGVVVATGALPLAFVAGLYLVPGELAAANLLLAAAMVLVFSVAALLTVGGGVVSFIAGVVLGVIGSLATLLGTLVDYPPEAIGAAAATVALAALSLLPRLTIQLAKLPLPQVPTSSEEAGAEESFPDFSMIEKRSGVAHQYMTGMVIGCGALAGLGAVVAALGGGVFGMIFAVVVGAVMFLRARSYANGAQAIALLVTSIATFVGVLLGWTYLADAFTRSLWIFGSVLVLTVGGLLAGVAAPKKRFSPVQRRALDIFEALLIAAVIPLALAVIGLYSSMRFL